MNLLKDGLNYLGTIDDVVGRYPWRFKVTERRLRHSLITQVIDGRPILLNDGYLVHSPIVRKAIMTRDHLVWELLAAGFIRLFVRGRKGYRLDEMPERMAHIRSFRMLVENRDPGVDWKDFKSCLAGVQKELQRNHSFISWTKYDAGSGYLALANRIRRRGATPRSLGIGRVVSAPALDYFLGRFVERMEKNTAGPRDCWEQLAKQVADNRKYNVEDPVSFVRELMQLGNEIYHYNQGIMLAASRRIPVSVETQASPAFDDLLQVEDVAFAEIPLVPRIHVPMAISDVEPRKLRLLLDPATPAGVARQRWVEAKRAFAPGDDPARERAVDAAAEYSARICESLGGQVNYRIREDFFTFALSSMVSPGTAGVSTATGVGAAVVTGSPVVGGAVAVGTGFLVTCLQGMVAGSLTKKYRVHRLGKDLQKYTRELERSRKIAARIGQRKIPSCIELDRAAARVLAKSIRQFTG